MLVTAVDVVDAANDNALLVPMVEQAEETMGTKSQMTVGRCWILRRESLGRMRPSRSAGGSVGVAATVPQRPISQGPIHLRRAERQLYVSAGTDAQVRFVSNIRMESRCVCTGPPGSSAKCAQPSESARRPKRLGGAWR